MGIAATPPSTSPVTPTHTCYLIDGFMLSLQTLMERQKRKADIEKGLQFIQ